MESFGKIEDTSDLTMSFFSAIHLDRYLGSKLALL
jgi:hypothetical protein